MSSALRAYLQTEGKIDYRQCQIAYYTYSMFETPSRFRVNVNVHIQSPSKQLKKTLNIDNTFDKEGEAINYGIEQGKKYIDDNYAAGKISFIKHEEKSHKLFTPTAKPTSPNAKPGVKRKDQK